MTMSQAQSEAGVNAKNKPDNDIEPDLESELQQISQRHGVQLTEIQNEYRRQRASHDIVLTIGSAILCAGISFFLYLNLKPITDSNRDDFLKLLSAGAAFAGVLISSWYGRANAHLQADTQFKIEGIKQDNALELASAQAKFAVIVNRHNKSYEAKLNSDLEKLKGDVARFNLEYAERIKSRSTALETLHPKMQNLYDSLRLLENGNGDLESILSRLAEAESCSDEMLSRLPESFQRAWVRLVQECVETVGLLCAKRPLDQRRSWQKQRDKLQNGYIFYLEEVGHVTKLPAPE